MNFLSVISVAPSLNSQSICSDRYSSASVGHPHLENEPSAFYGEEDEAGYASEKEHSEDDIVDRATKTKKVSFAAENEQFHLKPDPDVKVIPGTDLEKKSTSTKKS